MAFWPKNAYQHLVQDTELVVSLKGLIVNVGIVPQVISEVVLRLYPLNQKGEFVFDPYALMGPNCFSSTDDGWGNDLQELFRPLVVEARSNLIYHFLFVPVGKTENRMKGLHADDYRAVLEFKRPNRPSKFVSFTFQLSDSAVDTFLQGNSGVGVLTRNVSVE